MGTPEFALLPLERILDAGYDVAGVVTVADKPSGRGRGIRASAVKTFSLKHGLPVLQPESLKDEAFLQQLKSLKANVFVVVAFRKLPAEVWQIPELGCFNLHASLLPQYRGAAPINHALINGESETGVTTFFIDENIDTGKIILQRSLDIGPDITAGELHDKLSELGAQTIIETLQSIERGSIQTKVQPSTAIPLKAAPRIFREHGLINWEQPAQTIHNLIRGLSPFPAAWSALMLNDTKREMKLLKSALTHLQAEIAPGSVMIMPDSKLLVACGDEMLEIVVLQPAGKNAMAADAFIRGIQSGTRLKFTV